MISTGLGDLLFDRVAAHGTVGDAEQEIVLAAVDSDEALASLLGKGADRPHDPIAIESTGSWRAAYFRWSQCDNPKG